MMTKFRCDSWSRALSLLLVLSLLALPTVAMAAETAPVETAAATTPPPSLIVDWQTAVQNALIEVPGVVKDFSMDGEDGRPCYELEIIQESGAEYDVKVDMLTGKILRKENEGISAHHQDYLGVKVSYDQAVATALASLTPEGELLAVLPVMSDFDLDRKSDTLQYKVEILDVNGVEYDVRVDASTGEVVSSQPDYSPEDLPAGRISLEEARAIALEQAPGGEVLYIKLDRDDGHWQYEVHLVSAEGGYGELDLDVESGDVMEEDWDD